VNETEARGWLAEAARRGAKAKNLWRPQAGPQSLAYYSLADELLYGGAAGGGKTDLGLGVAYREHWRSIIFRRVSPSLAAIIDRSREIYNPDRDPALKDSFNESLFRWKFADGRHVRFGHIQYEADMAKFQGQPHDLYVFDEITEFSEAQYRFVTGWNRSTRPGQRCRVIATGNPPTTAEGEWCIKYWGPWLDPDHPNPAKPGELRWCTTIAGQDVWVPDGRPFVLSKKGDAQAERIYDFDPVQYDPSDIITPRSRTFIPAKVQDNAFLLGTPYVARLQALPEPLRSKFLLGDWRAGREDDSFQVIPSEWVRLAQERWAKAVKPKMPMSMMGVDVARGGADKTVLTPRYGNWIAPQICEPGKATPNGPAVASLVVKHRDVDAPVNIDVIGIGSSPFDCLQAALLMLVKPDGSEETRTELIKPMNGSEASEKKDRSGQLGFVNKRAEWWWTMREALDPEPPNTAPQNIALPPDAELRSDLCAPRWKLTVRGIQVESKDEIIKRIGRSPDRGDSCVYAVAEPRGGGYSYESVKVARRAPIGNRAVRDDDDDDDEVATTIRAPMGGMFGGARRRC
jgi:hypothetical protein